MYARVFVRRCAAKRGRKEVFDEMAFPMKLFTESLQRSPAFAPRMLAYSHQTTFPRCLREEKADAMM